MTPIPKLDAVLASLADCREVTPIEDAYSLIICEDTSDMDRRSLIAAIARKCDDSLGKVREAALWALWWSSHRGHANPAFVAKSLHAATLDDVQRIRAGAWRLLNSHVIVQAGCGASPIRARGERRGVDPIKGARDYRRAVDELALLKSRDNNEQDRRYMLDLQSVLRRFRDFTGGRAVATSQQMLTYLVEDVRKTTLEEVERDVKINGLRDFLDGRRNLQEDERRELTSYFRVHADAFGETDDEA